MRAPVTLDHVLQLSKGSGHSRSDIVAERHCAQKPRTIDGELLPCREVESAAGVSGGLLYSAREKIKNNGHKNKVHDDFDLNKWKVSYIAELLLGPVKLYGSFATKSMWDGKFNPVTGKNEPPLDQTPYTVGFRFANW